MITKFITETQVYTETQLDVDSFCNDIIFYNQASGTIYVNGFPVAVGANYAINGNNDEINVTKYKLSFAGGTGSVYVTRKKFI
jgi:hypothetical protein